MTIYFEGTIFVLVLLVALMAIVAININKD